MRKHDSICLSNAGARLLFILWAAMSSSLWAQDLVDSDSLVAQASDEAEQAIARFRIPEGWRVELFAAEPLVANPVAFSLDAEGRAYVCESFRQNRGVTDNRGHDQEWLNADLAAQSVDDRRAYHLRLLGPEAEQYTRYDDRIRVVSDRDGDGKADESRVFADGFRDLVDGTGADVLINGGDVYYTCIPHLWLLRDENGDGRADLRKPLHSGYGVRVAFRGHDLHGLCLGPDGRLYFSVGDRGYNIELDGERLLNPESGAVFRCWLDGSHLEVVASGLRNPQDLTFDDLGNLFTGDNNSDSGDRARWVYVVEGADSGWRMAYQYLGDRGPFNREKIWQPFQDDTPAYIIPPVANLADGPSGLQYYPGVGLNERFRGRFFLCDFRGAAGQSGIRSFTVEPQGAFFRLNDEEQAIWGILATDLEFGSDGGLYVSDWVDGWDGSGKGRVYRLVDDTADAAAVKEVRELLRGGVNSVQSLAALGALLGHADQRVRRQAQFELVRRKASEVLVSAAQSSSASLLSRLHAVWGLGQLCRTGNEQAINQWSPVLQGLLNDDQGEIRGQAAQLLGEFRVSSALPQLMRMQRDGDARARCFAAQALGKLGDAAAVPALVSLLIDNNNQDPILRHSGIMGLAGCANPEMLADLAGHPAMAVRLASVVALRRQGSAHVADYLHDADPRVAVEAARAIHDVPIPAAMPALAALVERPVDDDAILRRVLNANFRLGDVEHARALARYASRREAPQHLRMEALEMLGQWGRPEARDRVLGMWRPLDKREPQPAADALRTYLAATLVGPEAVREKAIETAAKLGIQEATPLLVELLENASTSPAARGDALRALQVLGYQDLDKLISTSLQSPHESLRAVARSVWAKHAPNAALPALSAAVHAPSLIERQMALGDLSSLPQSLAGNVLRLALQELLDGKLPADTQLDVVEAAEQSGDAQLRPLLDQYYASLTAGDAIAPYRVAMEGGHPLRGAAIFFERTAVSCVRCHAIDGRGGKVGPDLSSVGKEKTREYLLESIVDPNRTIAKGFESVVLAGADGRVITGVVKFEDAHVLRVMTDEGVETEIAKENIEQRAKGRSAMPADLLKYLSRFDVRDLVAYLATLQGPERRDAGVIQQNGG